MDILGIIWDLLMWGIGFFCLAITFGVGLFFSLLLYKGAESLGSALNLNLNRSLVDFGVRTLVFLFGLVSCLLVRVPLKEVIQSFLVVGTFDELAMEMASGDYSFFLNNAVSVFWTQFILLFIFFLPYFFVTEAINLIKMVVCSKHEDIGYSLISFIPEMMTLFTTNVVVLIMGDRLALRLLEFIRIIDIRNGLFSMLFNMLLFCFYVYRVLCDFFGSDIFLSMFGANIAAVILGAQLTEGAHITVVILCFVIGYLSKAIRNAVVSLYSALNYAGFADGYSVVYGVISLVSMTGIFTIILKVMGF